MLLLVTRGLPVAVPIALALVAVYSILPVLALVRWRGWPFYPGRLFRLLVVRVVLYVQLLLPFAALAALIGVAIGALTGAPWHVGRLVLALALLVLIALLAAGWIGSRMLVVRDVVATIPSLPAAFDGFRIAQISDVHVGPHTPRRFLRRVALAIAGSDADLVVSTGDLVDDRHEDVERYADAFASLTAPAGVFAVAGNHDVYAGWDRVEAELRRLLPDTTVLVNDARTIERDGASLALVGVGDPAGGSRWRDPEGTSSRAAPDVERAFADVPAGAVVVALAHNPVLWPLVAARGAALTLSGHTHWGQLALPHIEWSLASPFLEHDMGAHSENGALLYISPGTGYWGVPFRLGALPEVTVVELRAGGTAGVDAGRDGGAELRVGRARRVRRGGVVADG